MSDDDKKKKDKKKDEDTQVYSGSKSAKDLAFAEWVTKQWKRGEKLERIDVIQWITKGPNKGPGDVRDFEMFPTGHAVDLEEAIDLTNRFLGSCQLTVDRVEKKPTNFYARAFDRGRNPVSRDMSGGDPVDTFPLSLTPGIYAKGGTDGAAEDDGTSTPQTVSLAYLQAGIGAYQRDLDRQDGNFGDLVAMFLTERREQRFYEKQLQTDMRQLLHDVTRVTLESAQAMAAMIRDKEGQDLQREITKLKVDGLREAGRYGKNLLTAVMPKLGGGGGTTTKALNGVSPGNEDEPQIVTEMTRERSLIENFFNDCRNAKIDKDLFGDFKKDDSTGKIHQVSQGIFTIEQFLVLGRVHSGRATADALDVLLMDSGKPTAVTMEQLGKVQALEKWSDSIGVSLVSLFKIRTAARDEARATASQGTTSSDHTSGDHTSQAKTPVAQASPTETTSAPKVRVAPTTLTDEEQNV